MRLWPWRKKSPERTPLTRYRHWPHNIKKFYPEIFERDSALPAYEAFRREYPEVADRFPPDVPSYELADYIEKHEIEPQ